jgi:2',3'-cyclic-nucleotide 2'-phosphodiesterase (5'-nucleotidase family)
LLTALSLAVILSVLVAPLAFADPPAPEADDQARYKTISVVSTNDFHGALVGRVHSWSHGDVVGSSDYLAGYINLVRQEELSDVLLLDAGDIMQGTLVSNYFYGASTIDIYNKMGYDAAAIGNHEFDWGVDVLQDRMDQADFPFLAANIYYKANDERPDWAQPYVVKRLGGNIKVGIIGIANPETPSITNPVNVADLYFTDGEAETDQIAAELEAQGVHVIIALVHIGGFWPDFGDLGVYACGVDSDLVDLIVSGHTHSDIRDEICGIPTVQAYSSGTAFARVDLMVDKRTGEVADYWMNPYPTSTYNTWYGEPATYRGRVVRPHRPISHLTAYYESLVEDLKNEVIGCANSDITREYRYESEMGDWVTDIMRAQDPGIDFAFTNSGGLREDIDAGPITFGEVFETLPFDNTQVIVELDGSEVRQVLEEGITGDHGVIQVSGLQFTFDYDLPVHSRIMGNVIDLSTGLPLNPAATYYVAVNDFMAGGGDEYFTLAANPQTNTYVLVRDLVVDWVKAAGCFDPPDPSVEQRITAYGTPPS